MLLRTLVTLAIAFAILVTAWCAGLGARDSPRVPADPRDRAVDLRCALEDSGARGHAPGARRTHAATL